MSESSATSSEPQPPLRSIHTASFPELLAEAAASVLVTTYQAGKLIILRHDAGVLNTHFRDFNKPMGLAVGQNKLAIGTNVEIAEFHNVPAVCSKLDASKEKGETAAERPRHDACFLPRRAHTTGDIQIHEMAWIGDELWFINTAFSCLSTRSDVNSFEVRWRPPFITKLAPEDSCHLNGLAARDGQADFVTALGETESRAGWRENKRNGGVLMDVQSN